METNKHKNRRKKILYLISACLSLFATILVICTMPPILQIHAQTSPQPQKTNTNNSKEYNTVQPSIIPNDSSGKLFIPHNIDETSNKDYLENRVMPGIASTIIGLTGGLSLIFAIISGIQLLTSYSNQEAENKAKNTLKWAIAGLIIASLSYAIVAIIASIKV